MDRSGRTGDSVCTGVAYENAERRRGERGAARDHLIIARSDPVQVQHGEGVRGDEAG